MKTLLSFIFALLLPALVSAQTVAQGAPTTTSDAKAWPFKVVFGGVQIDPRAVNALPAGVNVFGNAAFGMPGPLMTLQLDGKYGVATIYLENSGAFIGTIKVAGFVVTNSKFIQAINVTDGTGLTDTLTFGKVYAVPVSGLSGVVIYVSAYTSGSFDYEMYAGAGSLGFPLGTQAVSGSFLTDTQLRASAVPISAASLPLPTGAATSALQTTGNSSLGSLASTIDSNLNLRVDVAAVGGLAQAVDVSHGVSGLGTIRVELPTDGTGRVNLGAGSQLVGKVGIDQTTPGTTNRVDVGVSALPTGASTSALQTTGNTSVGSIDTKTPALGQALAAASVPVVLTAAQITTLTPLSTVTVTDGAGAMNVIVDSATLGTVTVSDGAGAMNTIVDSGTLTAVTSITNAVTVTDGAGAMNVIVDSATLGTVTVSDGAGAMNTIIDSGTITAVTAITNALPAGNNNIGDVDVATLPALVAGTAVIGHVIVDTTSTTAVTQATAANLNATVVGPTLTKGTQGAAGFSTQDLKDAGRTTISFYANTFAAGATTVEKIITWDQSKGTGAITAATASYTITSGKTLRITGLSVATRGHATATIQTTTFKLRLNTAGACVVTSTPILFAAESATPATASAWDRYVIPIPDGYEIAGNGTIALCITAASTFVTNAPTWNVNLIGYEY